eukprot:GFUD01043110.1.p1 GENE.GFUD01043110.1~~GFUD01043110.1.p1  ORF type:complete len:134 (+),score=43.81 GFUD01043110.1:434-835(+)
MKLSLCSTPDHPLPYSANFQLFFSSATTVPSHRPDGDSSSPYSGVTPPPSPSPPSSLCHSPTQDQNPVSCPSPPSPGVSLLPLSGQMTQAVDQGAPPASDLHPEDQNAIKTSSEKCLEWRKRSQPARGSRWIF